MRTLRQTIAVAVLFPLCSCLSGGCATYQRLPLENDPKMTAVLTLSQDEIRSLTATANERGEGVTVDLSDGVSPDEAAVVAVIASPSLRAERSKLQVASAQLVQAGLLPNPQLTASVDPVTGGNTTDTSTGWLVGLDWEVTALIAHDAKVSAARHEAASVRLDVAWKEWQASAAARLAVVDLMAARALLAEAVDEDQALAENLASVRSAYEKRLKTIVEVATAETASRAAHAAVLTGEREVAHQRAQLTRAMGLPPAQAVTADARLRLPAAIALPSSTVLYEGIGERRLDLVALRRGYDAQEDTLHAAVLAQFPKVSLGFNRANDTSNVHTFGFGVTVDLPIFDHNQGAIATATATRQQLRDEYADRLFTARADVATAIEDIEALGREIAAAEEASAAAGRLTETYRKAAEARNLDVAGYYTAWNEWAQRRAEVIKLKQLLVQNAVALEVAAGRRILGLVVHERATTTAPATRDAKEPSR
jgi:cobalt-zinc-cadmium efflux system outer membrane protein